MALWLDCSHGVDCHLLPKGIDHNKISLLDVGLAAGNDRFPPTADQNDKGIFGKGGSFTVLPRH